MPWRPRVCHGQATEGRRWHHPSGLYGTFDWKQLSFVAPIARDADEGEIHLGLQDSSGSVWFDSLNVTVYKGVPPQRPQPPAYPGPVFRGHDLPRLRGVMSPNAFRDEDLRVLASEWNANVIRWQITRNWGRAGTDRHLAEYNHWFEGKLKELDQALEAAYRYGIKVVIYQVHMYVPGEFTHQGVGNQRTGIAYPGEIGGVIWDKERLRRELEPVREYQGLEGLHVREKRVTIFSMFSPKLRFHSAAPPDCAAVQRVPLLTMY